MLYPTIPLGTTYAATLFMRAYASAPEPLNGFPVIWSDDFSGSGDFDTSKWQYYQGSIENGEQEPYPISGDYCKLSGQGSLLITPENNKGQWASCRIKTTNNLHLLLVDSSSCKPALSSERRERTSKEFGLLFGLWAKASRRHFLA
jgi:hypothetical protein